MGLQDVQQQTDPAELRLFTRRLLRDLRALEQMLEQGCFEEGVRRIGAEQELFLIDDGFQPASRALEVLEHLDDPHFTTELGLFNIEYNLDPLLFGGDCLRRLEAQCLQLQAKARAAARAAGAEILLTGILPTLKLGDLTLEQMTPLPRYRALNDALGKLRGGSYAVNIKGTDEFMVEHDNVMLESCNTSFQVHFQVGPTEFADLYNIAQLVAAPVMAVATNSPLLFGRRLWRETRIALFQQSVDTRPNNPTVRQRMPRVSFGNDWVDEGVLEIFREDISRFRVLLNTEEDEDPFEALEAGRPPSLKALRLHNGTVYRWNRACYGISEGKPHLRIENRVLPSGPSVIDQVANAAFWFGLMTSVSAEFGDVASRLDFDDARNNFLNAARQGLGAPITWIDGDTTPAHELIVDRLLPMAREGLIDRGIDADDVARYLDVVARRVERRRTGADWTLDSLAAMKQTKPSTSEQMSALTAATLARQQSGEPVHTWELAELAEGAQWKHDYWRVGQFMTTDLFTVNQDELIELVANLMDWQHLRHVPVEDDQERLCGLITYRAILRWLGSPEACAEPSSVAASDVMQSDLVTVTPDTLTIDAIRLMREHDISCLPVVQDEKLVGLITEHDLVEIARTLLEEKLGEG